MTKQQFELAIADFDARMDRAASDGDIEALEALYAECVAYLDGEEPTDEEVAL